MRKTNKFFILFLVLFIFRFGLATLFTNDDFYNHFVWVESIRKLGFAGFYNRDFSPWAVANYPPVATFLFFWMDGLGRLLSSPGSGIGLLASFYKLPGLLIETVLIVFFAAEVSFTSGLVLLFNPGIFYNTIFWGQTEGLITSLVFFSFYFFFTKNKFLSWLLITAAVLVKQTSWLFLPIFLLVAFWKFPKKQFFVGIFVSIFLGYFLFSFFTGREILFFPWRFALGTVGGQAHQMMASVNAFNFWYLLGLNDISDSGLWLGISYRIWGIILFLILSIPVIAKLATAKKKSFGLVLAACGLLNLIYFLFMTRVHERYLFPSLIFLMPLVVSSWQGYLVYFFLSLSHFFNLYWVWKFPQFRIFSFVFEPLTAKIIVIISFICFGYFFVKFLIKTDYDF